MRIRPISEAEIEYGCTEIISVVEDNVSIA